MMRTVPDSLVSRIGVVTASAVIITVVVTALISVGLVRTAALDGGQNALNQHADAVTALINTGLARGALARPLEVLEAQDTPAALVLRTGEMRGDEQAKAAIAPRLAELAAGRPVSFRTTMNGNVVLVAARPIKDGRAVVLAPTASAATALAQDVLQRQLVALFIGLVLALALGLLLARRLAEPLSRVAAAAQQLSAGTRDIRVHSDGPTEVAQVAESLNTLADALQTSEARQREFLLSVSHELRTPLTTVRGFAEALADGVVTGDNVAATGRTMLAESTRLQRLVNDLLDLARLGTADFRLDVGPVDLTLMMTESAQAWATRCAEADIELRAELPDAPLLAETDPIRLRQIIDGLMENALRVTPAGAPIVLALQALSDPEPHALFEVRDGGPGLTPDDQQVAFQRSVLYQRYRGVRQVGTGLGLALVHGLATRLGATAAAGTAPEGGAQFQIRLPITGTQEVPPAPPNDPGRHGQAPEE